MKEALSEAIQTHGLVKVLLIDDAYDPPSVEYALTHLQAFKDELKDDSDWRVVADVLAEPELDEDRLGELAEQADVVSRLFGSREQLPPQAWFALFRDFEAERESKLSQLQPIVDEFQALGCEVNSTGSAAPGGRSEAGIVLMDLYMRHEITADEAARDAADKLRLHLPERKPAPLIILISSQEPDLLLVRVAFREHANVSGARFTFVPKRLFREQLEEVEYRLYHLVSHHPMSARFDEMASSFREAADEIADAFTRELQRLEVADYADLRDLVVNPEGVRLGEYLLELYGMFWSALCEANESLVANLRELDSLDLSVDRYPPNEISPSAGVLDIFEKTLYRPKQALPTLEKFWGLALGDILATHTEAGKVDAVYIVIAQDCDMSRESVDAVFLVPVQMEKRPIKRKNDVKELPLTVEGERRAIEPLYSRWRALRASEFEEFVTTDRLERIGRLRLMWASMCQQELLQRIGRPATMSLPHEVHGVGLEVLVRGKKDKAVVVYSEVDDTDGFLLIGRDEKGDTRRLVISQHVLGTLRLALREFVGGGRADPPSETWLRQLLDDPKRLDALKGRLVVNSDGNKCIAQPQLQGAGTTIKTPYINGNNPGPDLHLMINIKQSK